jgi:hypothetical protein
MRDTVPTLLEHQLPSNAFSELGRNHQMLRNDEL